MLDQVCRVAWNAVNTQVILTGEEALQDFGVQVASSSGIFRCSNLEVNVNLVCTLLIPSGRIKIEFNLHFGKSFKEASQQRCQSVLRKTNGSGYPQQSTWIHALPLNEFAAFPQRPQSTPA